MTSLASNPTVLYGAIGLCGLIVGPFVLRFIIGLAPGSLKERAARWQLYRGLKMGDGWLVHQNGDRSYQLSAIDTDSDTVTVEGESVDLGNLGHIATKTGSIPMGVSYGPGAVEDSPLVGVSADSHVGDVPGSDEETGSDGDGPGPDDGGGSDDDGPDQHVETGLGADSQISYATANDGGNL